MYRMRDRERMDSVSTYLVLIFASTLSSFFTLPAHSSRLLSDPPHNQQIFSVISYGAVGDGVADDTQPFRAAWDAACQADSPAVSLGITPSSSDPFLSPAPAKIDSLFSLLPPDSWPDSRSKRRWVVFNKIEGMRMHGGGVVDGRGHKWWQLPCKPHRGVNGTTLPGPCYSPVAIMFTRSSNLVVDDLEVKNSPQFHLRFEKCRNVHVDSLYINSPAASPNTDGIHVGKSSNVGIYNSVIATGDDCISIGAATFNVDIRNITCDHSHGISIGSLGPNNSSACVSNITVRDSVIKRSDNGVRIKTWQGGYGTVSNVSFDNIEMDNVRNPIIIDQYYCNSGTSCSNQTSAVHVTGISYTAIRGTYDARTPPIHLACSDTQPCTDLSVSDVELLPEQGRATVDPFCWNAYGDGGAVTVPPLMCLNRGEPSSFPSNDVDVCSVLGSGPGLRGVEPKAGNMLGPNNMYIVNILSLQISFFFFVSIAVWGILNLAPKLTSYS